MTLDAAAFACVDLVIGRVHQERQRHLEGIVHLAVIDAELEAGRHARQRRHDAKAERGARRRRDSRSARRSRGRARPPLRASRKAASSGVSSVASILPPGKDIWPAWSARCAARWVSSTVGSRARRPDQHRGGPQRRSSATIAMIRSIAVVAADGRRGGSVRPARHDEIQPLAGTAEEFQPRRAAGRSLLHIGSFKARPSPAPPAPSRRMRPKMSRRTSPCHRSFAPRPARRDRNKAAA